MTEADRYWQRKVSANAALADPATKVTMKSAALEREIRKAFEAGRVHGFKQGHKVGKLSKVTDAERTKLDEFFDAFGDK